MIPGRPFSLILCVTGAECTGKTTLAEALARELRVPLVPEVARSYLAGRSDYQAPDVLEIARIQQAAELAAVAEAPVVVADTDLTVIQVWWEDKYGAPDPWIHQALRERTERRYLLPRPDLPWQFDPLRESPRDRPRLHRRYRQLLEQGPFPFAEIGGTGEARYVNALRAVEGWLPPGTRLPASAPD